MTSLRFCPEQIELMPIARLKPYANNARTHSEDQIARIAASLVEYGWTAPVMVADDGAIVAGHGRLSPVMPSRVRADRIAKVRWRRNDCHRKRSLEISLESKNQPLPGCFLRSRAKIRWWLD